VETSPGAYLLKLAWAFVCGLRVTVQVGVMPVQLPLQPTTLLPAGGVAVSVTTVPGATFSGQVPGQVAGGLGNQEIGARLGLAEKTIKHDMTKILQKLQVRSRVEAALLASKAGLRPPS